MTIAEQYELTIKPIRTTRHDRIAMLLVALADNEQNFPPSTSLRPLQERRPDLYQ